MTELRGGGPISDPAFNLYGTYNSQPVSSVTATTLDLPPTSTLSPLNPHPRSILPIVALGAALFLLGGRRGL